MIAAPQATFVTVGDLSAAGVSPAAARQCLRREAARPDGVVVRAAHGLYWKVRQNTDRNGQPTRYGPCPMRLARRIAGPGAGQTGLGAVNKYRLSTQLVAVQELAVVGQPPTSPNPDRIRFVKRSNVRRLELDFDEVTFLEAMLCYPQCRCEERWWSSMSTVHATVRGIRDRQWKQASDGDPGAPRVLDPALHDLIREVAKSDNLGGKSYLERVDQYLGIVADAYEYSDSKAAAAGVMRASA